MSFLLSGEEMKFNGGSLMYKEDSRIQKAYELGVRYESEYRGCCQCTLGALQDAFGKSDDAVFKASTGLATGTGLIGSAGCGGYSGGTIFVGQFIGRGRENFKESSSSTGIFQIIKEFHDRFIKEYGSVICSDIQKKVFGRSFNLLNKDEKILFEKMGGHRNKCPIVVGKAAAWMAEIILKHPELFYIY